MFLFSSMFSIQLLFRPFIFPVDYVPFLKSFWYLFHLFLYCQRSYITFKIFLSESRWSVWQDFKIWGATLVSKSVSQTSMKWLNHWVPEFDFALGVHLLGCIRKVWCVLPSRQRHLCCNNSLCFLQLQTAFPSLLSVWACLPWTPQTPCFVILWYLGVILGLLPLFSLWAVPYFSSLTQSYLKSSNWNTKMKCPRLHIFIPINHWICVPVFTPLVFLISDFYFGIHKIYFL